MNKKILTGLIVILIVLLSLMVVRFLTPEDIWICVEGEWMNRGNSEVERPIEDCPDKANFANAEIPLNLDKNLKDYYEVYFSNSKLDPGASCLKVFPIKKPVGNGLPAQAGELGLRKNLEVLLQGPTEKDKEDGYFTNIPDNVKINRLEKTGISVKVDFDRNIEIGVGGSCRVGAIRAQIVKTVLAFDKSIRSVIISVDGEIESALQP